jgi:hypothetical protein
MAVAMQLSILAGSFVGSCAGGFTGVFLAFFPELMILGKGTCITSVPTDKPTKFNFRSNFRH